MLRPCSVWRLSAIAWEHEWPRAQGEAFSGLPASCSCGVSVLRLLFILAGGLTGLYGLMLGMAALFVNICSLSPYGVPYAAPIAPLNVRSLGDVFYRESWTKLARRRVRVQDLRGAHIDQCE